MTTERNAQGVDVLDILRDAAREGRYERDRVAPFGADEWQSEVDSAIAAVAELIRLHERVLYVHTLTGNAKARAWDKLDREIRAALARVQGGEA